LSPLFSNVPHPLKLVDTASAWCLGIAAGCVIFATGCGQVDQGQEPPSALPDTEWPLHGLTAAEARFSPLDQIHVDNVGRLGLAWSFDMDSTRGLEATPIMVDGVLYVTSTWSRVYAVDARTGTLLWEYDPDVPGGWARHACCDVVNRGVAISGDRVFVGTLDGRLVALNRADGRVLWDTDTINRSPPYTITGAPRVVGDLVIIGNGGGEFNVRGYVSAYRADTGEMAWRFYTVPGRGDDPHENPALERAAETWPGVDWSVTGGGGTAWDSIAYDADLDLLYVGTGNGSPWARHMRSTESGDHLYLSSILALRPDTGALAWYYQTTPGDNWDYTATQNMILTELEIDDVQRKVLLQAPKNGFFYVLDRATGELLSAEPYVTVTWASHIDMVSGRPVETGQGDYSEQRQLVFPSTLGGHNWHPMAYSPETGLVYIPAREASGYFHPTKLNWFELGSEEAARQTGQPTPKIAGQLLAWDPVTQQAAWRVHQPGLYNGGVLATAGNLVLHGDGDGFLYAHAADTGEERLKLELGTGVIAPPITYSLDGVQYVALLAGYNGIEDDSTPVHRYRNDGRLLVFKLDGRPVPLPKQRPPPQPFPPPADLAAIPGEISHGEGLYLRWCVGCHGIEGTTRGPDLRRMTLGTRGVFHEIVMDGLYAPKGMAGFDDVLSQDDSLAILAFLNEQTRQAHLAQQDGTWAD